MIFIYKYCNEECWLFNECESKYREDLVCCLKRLDNPAYKEQTIILNNVEFNLDKSKDNKNE